jgi:hypothetical protein
VGSKRAKHTHKIRPELIINMAVGLSLARKISGTPIKNASSTTIIKKTIRKFC